MLNFDIVPKVYAAGCDTSSNSLNLGECLQLGNGQSVADVYKDPAFLINLIVRNLFVIAGFIFFVLIIYGGFMFISSDSAKVKDQASEMIKTAGIGFAVMFSAYWILQIVKVVTGVNIPGL